MTSITLVADDLTGACDAGALLAGAGPVAVCLDASAVDNASPVAAVDTASRALDRSQAARRVRDTGDALAARIRGGRLFKKVDSTLRGHVGAELDALLESTGVRGAVLAPALPAERRTVAGGRLLIGGIPAHETPIGRDPAFPAPTSSAVELVTASGARGAVPLPLGTVRGGAERLARALDLADGAIAVADAETDDDLDALAAALAVRTDLVPAGSAGLARALARVWGVMSAPPPLPEGRGWLIVAGSRHPATRAQVAALAETGALVVRIAPGEPMDPPPLARAVADGRPAILAAADTGADDPAARALMAAALARAARDVLAACRPDLIVVTGGETARALLGALGCRRIDLAGAPRPGLALGDLVLGAAAQPLLTKAGGFGGAGLLVGLLKGHA